MNVSTGITLALAGLAVGLSGCAAEPAKPAASSVTSSAKTVTSTVTATPTSTATSTPTSASSSSSATETARTSTPMVGGMTECTKAALAEPATQAAQALGPNNIYTVDQLECADGWAVTAGKLASKDNPDMGAPTSFVFEQEGQFWIPKDKAKVCGTNPVTTIPPADAEIPAALFLSGCAAG